MKKVIALVTLLSLAVAFSCVVSAAGVTYNASAHRIYNLENGVIVDVTARALYPSDDPLYGDSQYVDYDNVTWNCVVTVIVKNQTSYNKYIKNINPVLYLDKPTGGNYNNIDYNSVLSIENFSTDLMLTTGSENYLLWTVPSADWGFLDGFVVPANTTMTALAVVKFPARFYETSSQWWYSTLTDVQLLAEHQ